MGTIVKEGTSTHAMPHLQEWAWDNEQADAKGGGGGHQHPRDGALARVGVGQ